MKKSNFITNILWIWLVTLVVVIIGDIINVANLIQADTSFENIFESTRLPMKNIIIAGFITKELYQRGEIFFVKEEKEKS